MEHDYLIYKHAFYLIYKHGFNLIRIVDDVRVV
jgi:sRNA-binding regulator protein Hfq